jgi:hypothetical protein
VTCKRKHQTQKGVKVKLQMPSSKNENQKKKQQQINQIITVPNLEQI